MEKLGFKLFKKIFNVKNVLMVKYRNKKTTENIGNENYCHAKKHENK